MLTRWRPLFRGVGSRYLIWHWCKAGKVCYLFSTPMTPGVSAPVRIGFAKYEVFLLWLWTIRTSSALCLHPVFICNNASCDTLDTNFIMTRLCLFGAHVWISFVIPGWRGGARCLWNTAPTHQRPKPNIIFNGRLSGLLEKFLLPSEKCVGNTLKLLEIVWKIWDAFRKLLASLMSQAGYRLVC